MEARHLGETVIATIVSLSNVQFYLQGNYFSRAGALNILLMTWSLAVEEQFYVFFPLLLIVTHKYARRHVFAVLAAGCCLSLLLSVYMEFRHPEFNFYMPFTRAWELGAGTLLAVWQATRRAATGAFGASAGWRLQATGVVGLALLLGCVLFYSPATRFPGYEALPPVLGTVCLLVAEGSAANWVLKLRPLRAVGLISYSLYLWHWPLLSLAATICEQPPSPKAKALLMLCAGVAAVLSYFFVEKPFRNFRSTKTWTTLLRYGSAMVVVYVCGLLFAKTDGVSARARGLAVVENSIQVDRVYPCITSSDRGPIVSAFCVPAAGAKDSAVLLGDSHAEALQATLRARVEAAGHSLVVMTSFSCPALQGFTRYMPGDPQHGANCARFNDQARETVLRRPDIRVAYLVGSWPMVKDDFFAPTDTKGDPLSNSSQASAENLIAGITAEIRTLEGAGKRVVVIDDWPSLAFTPVDRVKYTQLPVRRWLADAMMGHGIEDAGATSVARAGTVTPEAEEVHSALVAAAERDSQLQVVDSKLLMCPEGRCALSDHGHILYTDGNHVSPSGAARILGGAGLTY